jgi:aspartyl-tRNA(Asn)/glutamyl-tRNA(Gln) amidotransferase subunit C
VLKIAKLARLELSDEEVEKFSGQLSDVLNYVEILNKVDTKDVEETSQVTGLVNVFRKDVVVPCDYGTDLIKQAAEYEDNQVKVKNVL